MVDCFRQPSAVAGPPGQLDQSEKEGWYPEGQPPRRQGRVRGG